MPDKPNPFKTAINARKQAKQEETPADLPSEPPTDDEPPELSIEKTVEPAIAQLQEIPVIEDVAQQGKIQSAQMPLEIASDVTVQPSTIPSIPQPQKKRGRPPSGKRSDDAWIGRTFYIKRETDLDIEELLVRLRRQGIEIDKSELVEMLLAALVKWHQGENLEIQLDEISPIQKS